VKRLILVAALTGASAFAQYTGFSVNSIDKSVSPCTDFFQYACGSWNKNNPIPPDQSRWGRFNELQERNLSILKDILETSAANKQRSAVEQKIGDYYASCMDEKAIEAKGTAPLKPELDRIAAMKDKRDLPALAARLGRVGASAFFAISVAPDYKNSKMMIAHASQGAITLPDRDYYLKPDAKSAEIRKKYAEHVTRVFQLLGHSDPAAAANNVIEIETQIAKANMDRVALRNPLNRYHMMPWSEFTALTPSFNFDRYAEGAGVSKVERLNVVNPEFYKSFEGILKSASLTTIKDYLTWRYVNMNAPMLPSAFVKENFEFFGRTLTGAKELRPRWKRCVSAVDSDLGEALGQKFVEMTFGPEAKKRMAVMIQDLGNALQKDINTLDWMTPATKKRALEKLQAIQNKVGHPEKWRDYTKLEIRPNDALGNSQRANTFAIERMLAKLGKAPDPTEWYMSPPTVNAYYSPLENNINFPAGILQPPFFDVKIDDAVNYGGIGAVIGHEITHGFDDQGRRFDAQGNMQDWWTPEDGKEYEKRAACIDEQYSAYSASPEVTDVKLNGKLTLGENVADNGGLRIAYMALLDRLEGKDRKPIDGYTPEQRFFLGFAQVWCQNMTDEAARLRAQTDPHSPGNWRVNGTLSNMPEFWQAFSCKPGDTMHRGEKACRVW
jgi:endothelin-converting enzyme/putative endopeptidase